MALDLTLGDAVRIGTAGLLALFGVILATRRSASRAAIPLGVGVAGLAVSMACSNVAFADAWPDMVLRVLEVVGSLLASVAIGRFAWLASPPPARGRTTWVLVLALAAGAIGAALTIAGGILDLGSVTRRSLAPGSFEGASQVGFYCAQAVLGAAGWSVVSSHDDIIPERARGPLAAGLLVYPLTFAGTDNDSVLILAGALVGAIPALVAVHRWANERAARRWWAAMVLVPLGALLVDGAVEGDLGMLGIVRVIAVGFLAHALFRADAFGEAARPTRDRRAAVLTGFLVILLIVAQVAQNFLAAQYSLLMGGIVSGALLVAARPIERALEGRREMRAQQPDGAKEEAYRAAVRMALRDRKITREEELHLHRVAQHMGITNARAHELLVEVEREAQPRE